MLTGGGPLPDGSALQADCYTFAEAAGTQAVLNEKYLRCTDGDPTCDQDGLCNGSCLFRARLCTGLSGATDCVPPPSLERIRLNRRCPLVAPPTLTGSVCGAFVDFTVPLKKRGGKLNAAEARCLSRAMAAPGVSPHTDRDVFVFKCLPRQGGCPPQ